jgi:ankyrin repeat protein
VNKLDDMGIPPLYYAAHSGKTAAVQLLLDHGADTSVINNDGSTGMHMAVLYGYVDIIKQLQQHGLDVRQSRIDGMNVLMLAEQELQLPAAEFAISCGVSVTATDGQGRTALHFATVCGMHPAVNRCEPDDLVKLLVAHGAALDACDHDDITPLLAAVFDKHAEAAAALIKAGANTAYVNKCGCTALFLAVREAMTDTVELLLKHDATAVLEVGMKLCAATCCGAVTPLMVSRGPAVA